MELNNYYKIEVKDFKNKTFSLIKNETSVKEKTICREITKIIKIENFYVEYLKKYGEDGNLQRYVRYSSSVYGV